MESHQRASGGYLAMGDWGVGDAGSVPDMVALLTPFSLTGAFDDFNPVGAPTGGWKGNANVLGQWAHRPIGYTNWIGSSAPDGRAAATTRASTPNSIVEEDTQAVYAQVALKFDMGGMPANLVIGARYEETDVNSLNSQLVPTDSASGRTTTTSRSSVRPSAAKRWSTATASYHNLLPNLDFDIGLTDSLKGRFSYSKTIARAGYGSLRRVQTPNGYPAARHSTGFTPAATRTIRPAAARVG